MLESRPTHPARTFLETRWNLGALPRLKLLAGPTPLESCSALAQEVGGELWIKRDDLTHPRYGGNKVRKLEWILGEAQHEGKDTIITTGAAGSHHVLATAIFGKAHGFKVHAVLVPQPASEHVTLDLRAMLAQGAELHPVRLFSAVPAALAALHAKLRIQGSRPLTVGPGGSHGAGLIGYVEAGLELAQQILEQRVQEPDAIVIPLGSGGTLAGLAVGLAAAGITSKIHAVRVTPKAVISRAVLAAQVRATVELLRSKDDRFPRVEAPALDLFHIDEGELGDGYGLPTPASREAIRVGAAHGIQLDVTYTAKAFAAALRLLRMGQKRVVFIQTLSSAPMEPLLENAPSVPHRLDVLLR